MAIVAEQVCGLCGKKIDDAHWKTHSLWERAAYWFRMPWIRIGNYELRVDRTGMVLLDHDKASFKERGHKLIWSWIWKHHA